MKARAVWIGGLLLAACGVEPGCRRGMYDQEHAKPLGEGEFFPDGASSRPLPAHVVPAPAAGEMEPESEAFRTGTNGTNFVTAMPLPVTGALLERGRGRFNIYCAVCHGRTGEGDGIVVQRGFPRPPSYHISALRAAPVGYVYDVITRGHGVMQGYAPVIEPADRWAIVAYGRALQLSQDAPVGLVPEDVRLRLEREAR